MSGVYGDMLAFFPELMLTYTTFTMRPKAVGGFEARENLSSARGIIQYMKAGDLNFEGETLADTEYPVFWTRVTLPKDSYIEDEDGTLYKRTKNNDWRRLGAFNSYTLELVVGVDGRQEADPAVDLGRSRYD